MSKSRDGLRRLPHELKWVLAVGIGALILCSPSTAFAAASSVKVQDGVLKVIAPAGANANSYEISQTSSSYIIKESAAGATLTKGSNCSGGGLSVTCSRPAVTALKLEVKAKDGSNTVLNDTTLTSTIEGGNADDWFYAGSGANTLKGLGEQDHLWGGAGDDYVYGGADIDFLWGGPGRDHLLGESGSDTIDYQDADGRYPGAAQDGRDYVDGGTGGETAAGDYYRGYVGRTAKVTLWQGDPAFSGGQGEQDVLTGFEVLFGGSGDDLFVGGSRAEELYGSEGNDTFSGRGGSDQYVCGGGSDDTVDYHGRSAPVTVTIGPDLHNDGEASEHDTVFEDCENVKGGAGDDTLVGTDSENELSGGPGNDGLTGNGGDDVLGSLVTVDGIAVSNEPGNDTAIGGAGADTIITGKDDDKLFGGTGNDFYLEYPGEGLDLFSDNLVLYGVEFVPDGGHDIMVTRDSVVETVRCGTNDNEFDGDPNDNGPELLLQVDTSATTGVLDNLTSC